MVFQEPNSVLNPVYTIGWQIEEGLRAHGMDEESSLVLFLVSSLLDESDLDVVAVWDDQWTIGQ